MSNGLFNPADLTVTALPTSIAAQAFSSISTQLQQQASSMSSHPIFDIPATGYLIVDGMRMSGKELKICLKMQLEMAKEKYPEEFI